MDKFNSQEVTFPEVLNKATFQPKTSLHSPKSDNTKTYQCICFFFFVQTL